MMALGGSLFVAGLAAALGIPSDSAPALVVFVIGTV
jgi:hypothetical protein